MIRKLYSIFISRILPFQCQQKYRMNKSENKINITQMLSQDLEESQILNQKFLELLQQKQEQSEDTQGLQFEVNQDEEDKIRAQFKNIANDRQYMDYMQFRQSLGLLGRQDSFISRIFHLIDADQDGLISSDEYLNYISTIIHGTQLQKQQFGWKIISRGKTQLNIRDLAQLFQQISIVWNALTGEIIQPKKRYIEEMFAILDVDQDQTITFQDYRVLYQEQPLLFGWFQYLNNIDINQAIIKNEFEKTKTLLHDNVLQKSHGSKNIQEVKVLIQNQETVIDSKMIQLIKQIKNATKYGKQKMSTSSSFSSSISLISSQKGYESTNNLSLSSLPHIGRFYDRNSPFQSVHNSNQGEEVSRLKRRKQKISIQNVQDTNIDMIKNLQQIMQKCVRTMNACEEYRELKQIQQRFSPTKLKLKEAKMKVVSKNQQRKQTQNIQGEVQKKKKKNVVIYFGHQNWNLVLNLMVGLRKSIKSLYELNSFLQLKSSHFTQEHKFLLGNKTLRGKNKQVYEFFEIAPVVFQKLRISYGISNFDYQKSVGPQSLLNSLLMGNLTGLNQKCSTGKSGSFFYLTLDNKIFLKTIPKREFDFFVQIIQSYYKHQKQFTNTLIVRIYGLYKLKVYQNKEKKDTIYFISMENIFKQIVGLPHNLLEIKQVYDLKGSLYGRSGQEGKQLKDNDWIKKKRKINLPKQLKEIFKNQIKVDSKFFKVNNVNDYSLMVAITKIDEKIWHQQKKLASQQRPINIFKDFQGGVLGSNVGEFYILSIIDILTVFETRKNFEYLFKSTFLSKDVSCIPPTEYCKRFRKFMYEAVEQSVQKSSARLSV